MPQNNLVAVKRPPKKVKAVDNPNGVAPVYGLPAIKKAWNPNTYDSGFQNWYSGNTLEGKAGIPHDDSNQVYDFLSFYRNGEYRNQEYGIDKHFPDTYKRTNHPTFSNESIYSTPEKPGGQWGGSDGEKYSPNGKFKFADGGDLPTVGSRPGITDILRNNFQYFTGAKLNEESQYRPSNSKDSTAKYYTYPELKSQVLNELTGSKVGIDGRGNNVPSDFDGIYDTIKNNLPNAIGNKVVKKRYMSSAGLGHYKVDVGEDKSGKYISAFDTFNWDLLPGKKYEMYDRIYKKDYDNITKKK